MRTIEVNLDEVQLDGLERMRSMAKQMAQIEDFHLLNKLHAYCDRCTKMTKLSEMVLVIDGHPTTKTIPKGKGHIDVQLKFNVPTIECREHHESSNPGG